MAPIMSRSNIHYASFNAVEVKIRNKFNKEIPDGRLTTENRKRQEKVQSFVTSD